MYLEKQVDVYVSECESLSISWICAYRVEGSKAKGQSVLFFCSKNTQCHGLVQHEIFLTAMGGGGVGWAEGIYRLSAAAFLLLYGPGLISLCMILCKRLRLLCFYF